VPRAFRLPYSRPLADRSSKARDDIISGKPQQGSAQDVAAGESKEEPTSDQQGTRADPGLTAVDLEQYRLLQQAQRVEFSPMPGPLLPPKP
jgi:hypothetical protein